jgi:rossmann fold nucleotide-binding protein involved in DNA uptake
MTAKCFKGIGDAWIQKNLSLSDIPYEYIVKKIKNENKNKNADVNDKIFKEKKERILSAIEQLGDSCDGVIAIGDKKFPHIRGNVKDAEKPSFIFYKGNLKLLNKNELNIAVIGLLNPDPSIIENENMVVEKLTRNGANIISGLALGCDTAAHKQALKSNGATVAILPSPLNNIIPKENRTLAEEIVENNGLLITEYLTPVKPNDFRAQSGRYIKRDRLQALFSDVVILAASYTPESEDSNSTKIDSGSRHAMEKAKEYGIKRAVIYNENNKDNPKYDLNRKIIKSDQAVIILNPVELQNPMDLLFNNKTSSNNLVQGDLF